MEQKFTHKISKGSRFNQIYIPKEFLNSFQVGDLVEVRLLERKIELYYSENMKKIEKLSPFKEELIKKIFVFLERFKEIKQIFVFGSFLTKKIDYSDIDIMLIVDKESEKLDKKIRSDLSDEFNLKFHLISVEKNGLERSLKVSPLTRSMLYYYVSNKEFKISRETQVIKNHILYLLMFPEDLLRFDFEEGIIYYDALRKLITIEYFLDEEEISPDKIDNELEKLIDKRKLIFIKENNFVNNKIRNEIKEIIRKKLRTIKKRLG